MAEPAGDAAAAFIRDAPFEVLKVLLGQLSPKWILRMRSVCKAWRDKLGNKALLARLTRAEPPQPLVVFDRAACAAGDYLHLTDHCVDSLDLRSGAPRTVLRFTDNDGYFVDAHDLDGDSDDAPPIEDRFHVDYERMANYGEAIYKPEVTVHASVDGYLLVSFSPSRRSWYVVNPATRHWVPLLFDPTTFDLDVIGFYEHARSGKYRVLCLRRSNAVVHQRAPTYTYHVVEFRPGQRRDIGLPVSPAARKDHGLRLGVERSCLSPPIQWKRGNMDLLWPPQRSQEYHLLVFATGDEVFSWKRPPPVAMGDDDQAMRLLEFPDDGNLGLSISRVNEATLELWCLDDYPKEVWVLKRRIQLTVPALQLGENRPWVPAVVSAEGDVLVEFRHGRMLLHCDRDGRLLRRFGFDDTRRSHRVLPVRHVLKRSLHQHPMFWPSENAVEREPPFFRWMGSASDDPSSQLQLVMAILQHLCST